MIQYVVYGSRTDIDTRPPRVRHSRTLGTVRSQSRSSKNPAVCFGPSAPLERERRSLVRAVSEFKRSEVSVISEGWASPPGATQPTEKKKRRLRH